MQTASRTIVLVGLLCGTAGTAVAQDYLPERYGMTAALGVGAATAGIACNPRCQGDRQTGPVYQVRGAANVTPQFTIAIEGNVFNKTFSTSNGEGRWQLIWGTLGFLWYPTAESETYVKVGIGASVWHAHTTFPDVGALDLNTHNLGFVAGVGRDYRLSTQYGLNVFADYLYAPRSTGYLHGVESGAEIGGDVINIGLAIIVF
jgi:hypothetical protein